MSHQQFNQFATSGSIDPNDLMASSGPMPMQNSGSFMGGSFQNFGGQPANNSAAAFSKGISVLDDDDLLEGLPHDHQGTSAPGQTNGQDFNNLGDFDFGMTTPNVYNQNGAAGLSIDQAHMNGYSNTPEGDPIQSPFVHNFNALQFRQMQGQQPFSSSLQSPVSYTGSPLAGSDLNDSYMTVKGRPRVQPPMPRKNDGYTGQPIRTTHQHQKTMSGQWDQTPSSMTSFPGSEFGGSPLQGTIHHNPQISDILKTGSLPPKLGATTSQEMKRRRRRESHNLVERRRRDNINERIQELSHLVPVHRLEDEKVRKALQNNSPLSPTLAGLSQSPPQATSGLAGPGARRATGNITTGIPVEEKDKGPNKGDILNGAVSWMRDLMWMLHTKLQQQEDLANMIAELGGAFPFQLTEDEKRMQSELLAAMKRNETSTFTYSRTHGSGLRVPEYTDAKGDPLSLSGLEATSLSPDGHSTGDSVQAGSAGQFWNSDVGGDGAVSFKEEDEYSMELN